MMTTLDSVNPLSGFSEQEPQAISDQDFAAVYETTIRPALHALRQERFLEVRANERLYTLWYPVPHAIGTILISHGFTEGARKYDEMVWYFTQSGYNVVVQAHCGHDKSYRLCSDLNLVHLDHFERYVQDLLFTARKVRWEFRHVPLYLYAHSMGGGIAICAVEQSGDLFSSLVLSSPMIRPNTGSVPWQAAKSIANLAVWQNHEKDYLPGQHPYQEEFFETAASTSPARFALYKQRRHHDPLLQTSAATMNWLKEAGKMERYIFRHVDQIHIPVLLLQAGKETFVDNNAQNAFLASLPASTYSEKVFLPLAKHEIYQSADDSLPAYLHSILTFLRACRQMDRSLSSRY